MDASSIVSIVLALISLAIAGIGLICFVRVVIAMRQNGERVLATCCLVTLFLGAGIVLAFVYGVLKSREWDLARTMMLWGMCIALQLMLLGAVLALPGGN